MTDFMKAKFNSRPASRAFRDNFDKIKPCASCEGAGEWKEEGMTVICPNCPTGRNKARAILNDDR
jgi:hypothetical protein